MQRRAYYLLFGLLLFLAYGCGEEPTAPTVHQGAEPMPLAKGAPKGETGDPAVLALMHDINDQLAAQGLNIAIGEIVFFTIGQGRPVNRIHQLPFRWVPNDPRRAAQGDDITYIVDQSAGATASGLTNAQTEAAIDRALNTWDTERALKKVALVKRADPGTDITFFDFILGLGGPGNFFAADIVNAGWWPKAFFDAVAPGGGDGILAFSISFLFAAGGVPTDINGDNYLDTALNEVYYNDNFGDPGGTRPGFPWGIDVALPGIDVETVALHENGHSLMLGHFGRPPTAVMNPPYAGMQHSPLPADRAGMFAIWGSWPNP